jgi:hypothetical protein
MSFLSAHASNDINGIEQPGLPPALAPAAPGTRPRLGRVAMARKRHLLLLRVALIYVGDCFRGRYRKLSVALSAMIRGRRLKAVH